MEQIHTHSLQRPSIPVSAEVVRELTEGDLIVRAAIAISPGTPRVKKMRGTHHKLAQALTHMSEAEAAVYTGYSTSRISILKNDPSFKELLSFYGEKRTEVFIDVTQRMADVATDTLDEIRDRLQDSPEEFKGRDLVEILKATADRGGHSPIQKKETKTMILTGEDLRRMKEEVNSNHNGQVRKVNHIEEGHRVRQYLEAKPGVPEDTGLILSANDNRPTSDVYSEETTAGVEGQGNDLREACGESLEENAGLGGTPRNDNGEPVV